jgi:hypothetical protein
VQVLGYPVLAAALRLQMAARAYHHRGDGYADAPVLVFALSVHDCLVRVAHAVVAPLRAAVLPAQQYGHAAVSCCGAQVIS